MFAPIFIMQKAKTTPSIVSETEKIPFSYPISVVENLYNLSGDFKSGKLKGIYAVNERMSTSQINANISRETKIYNNTAMPYILPNRDIEEDYLFLTLFIANNEIANPTLSRDSEFNFTIYQTYTMAFPNSPITPGAHPLTGYSLESNDVTTYPNMEAYLGEVYWRNYFGKRAADDIYDRLILTQEAPKNVDAIYEAFAYAFKKQDCIFYRLKPTDLKTTYTGGQPTEDDYDNIYYKQTIDTNIRLLTADDFISKVHPLEVMILPNVEIEDINDNKNRYRFAFISTPFPKHILSTGNGMVYPGISYMLHDIPDFDFKKVEREWW